MGRRDERIAVWAVEWKSVARVLGRLCRGVLLLSGVAWDCIGHCPGHRARVYPLQSLWGKGRANPVGTIQNRFPHDFSFGQGVVSGKLLLQNKE